MKFWRYLGCTIARIFFSIIFIIAGVKKFFTYSSTKASIGSMLSMWDSYQSSAFVEWFVHFIGSYVGFFIIIAAILEVVGGLIVLIGIKPRIGAFLLLVFLVPTTVIMHPFWLYDPNAAYVQMTAFLKNLSIIGALFFIWAYDDGYYSKKETSGVDDSQKEFEELEQDQIHHHFPEEPPEEHH